MKLKKLKVPKFIHRDDLGEFEFQDVEILFDPAINNIDVNTFNQNGDEYLLSEETIQKLSHASALRFFNQRNKEIVTQKKPLTVQEMKGIKNFLGVNGADLGKLIGMDKSSISRILSSTNQPIMHERAMLLLERFYDEIQTPGYSQIVLRNLKEEKKSKYQLDLIEPKVSIYAIAEYLIRVFEKYESAVTNLKLQKLIYYAQGIALGNYSEKLFSEDILAWQHGPVVKEIYDKYKSHKNGPILSDSSMNIDEVLNNERVKKILDETVSIYGVYTPWFLREKTHNEPTWYETAQDEVISDDKMLNFFRSQFV
ncbi:MAG: DUF4065 domain-containing protein [Bacteriovoracaceae bacterium]